jgi:hypothetical protein
MNAVSRIHKTRLVLISLSLLFGLIEARAGRFTLNPDGVSYLDLGDDLMRGDLWNFINAHWSPVYPALLGVSNWLLRPSLANELVVAHGVNFLIFVYAVLCFDAFCVQLLEQRRRWALNLPHVGDQGTAMEKQECWLTVAFFLMFWWASLRQLGLDELLADELLMGSIFLCLALLLRIWNNPTAGWPGSFLLGVCLGFGYLCKAIFFPLAGILILALFLAPCLLRTRVRFARLVLTLVGFVLVAGPWVGCLHYKYGRLTFSDSGRLNVIWWVNRALPPMSVLWTNPALGTPDHALRRVREQPAVYEFDRPISGTFPPWKDPAWWLSGAQPSVDLRGHWRQLKSETTKLSGIAAHPLGQCLFYLLLALAVEHLYRGKTQWPSLHGHAFRAIWLLLAYSVAGLFLYAILLVEPGYVAVFLLIFSIACLYGATLVFPLVLPDRLKFIVPTLAIVFAFVFLPGSAKSVWLCLPPRVSGAAASELPDRRQRDVYRLEVAQELQRHGLVPGTRVAIMGNWAAYHWARLCGVHIVADIPTDELPHLTSPDQLQRALDTFRRAGAEVAVVSVAEIPVKDCGGLELADGRLRLVDLRKTTSDFGERRDEAKR